MTKTEKEAKRKKLQEDLKALEDEKEEKEAEVEKKEEEAEEEEDAGNPSAAREKRREAKIVAADAASVQSLIELLREVLKKKEGIDDAELDKKVKERTKARNRW